jgi:hypothetical protein
VPKNVPKVSTEMTNQDDLYNQMNLLIKEFRSANKNLSEISQNLTQLNTKLDRKYRSNLVVRLENNIRNKALPKLRNYFGKLRHTKNTNKPSMNISTKKLEPEIALISWDISHNACGRAYWMAEALSEKFQVAVYGNMHTRLGHQLWKAISEVPIVTYYQEVDDTDFITAKQKYFSFGKNIEADTIICCKFRPASIYMLLGALSVRPRKVLFDFDDNELCFTSKTGSRRAIWLNENEDEVTQCYNMVKAMPGTRITAPNKQIQKLFPDASVTQINHPRPAWLCPNKNHENKTNFGLKIGFFGTLRIHKGLNELLDILEANSEIQLYIVGSIDDSALSALRLSRHSHRILIEGPCTYPELTSKLKLCDYVVYPSNEGSEVSHYQTTAKISDAVGAGITPVITKTLGNAHFIDDGVALDFGDIDWKSLTTSQQIRKQKLTEYYNDTICYTAVRKKITAEIEALDKTDLQLFKANTLKNLQVSNPLSVITIDNRFTYIHFWKQDDSGLYSRRVDNIAEAQIKQNTVKSVIVVNRPLTIKELERKYPEKSLQRTKRKQINWHHTQEGLNHYQPITTQLSSVHLLEFGESFIETIVEKDVHNRRYILYPYVDYFDLDNFEFNYSNTIVDIVDNQMLFQQTHKHSEKIKLQYVELAHRFKTINNRSHELLSDLSIEIDFVIPNAAKQVTFKHSEKPNQSQKIWYPGNLDPSRLDMTLINKITKKFPKTTLNFIGKSNIAHFNPENSNIKIHEPMRFEEMIINFRQDDILIVPHLRNDLVDSMDPLKLYFGAINGLTVVSTVAVQLFGNYPNTFMGLDHDNFLKVLGHAIYDDPQNGPIDRKVILDKRDLWQDRALAISHVFSK